MTEALQAFKSRLETLTAEFAELIARTVRTIVIPEMNIDLDVGEFYAGIVLSNSGVPLHHLIGMEGELDNSDWAAAMAWAKKAGGDLPTRQEQAVLFANTKDQFQKVAYWSNTQHADNSDYAWYQHFDYGNQDYGVKSSQLRARAVRRLPI